MQQTGDYPVPQSFRTSRRKTRLKTTTTGRGGFRKDVPPHLKMVAVDLEKRHRKLGTQSPFDLLDIPTVAGPSELERKYTQLTKKFDPKRAAMGLPSDLEQMAIELLEAVEVAYGLLKDPRQWKKHVKIHDEFKKSGSNVYPMPGLSGAKAPEPAKTTAAVEAPATSPKSKPSSTTKADLRDAALKFKMGLVLLNKRNFAAAREHLETATKLADGAALNDEVTVDLYASGRRSLAMVNYRGWTGEGVDECGGSDVDVHGFSLVSLSGKPQVILPPEEGEVELRGLWYRNGALEYALHTWPDEITIYNADGEAACGLALPFCDCPC